MFPGKNLSPPAVFAGASLWGWRPARHPVCPCRGRGSARPVIGWPPDSAAQSRPRSALPWQPSPRRPSPAPQAQTSSGPEHPLSRFPEDEISNFHLFLYKSFYKTCKYILLHKDTADNIAMSKGVYLTIWTINICTLTILYKALLKIIGGKGAISNINYYHYQELYFLTLFLLSWSLSCSTLALCSRWAIWLVHCWYFCL